jgi:hypothetical protein
LQGARQHVLAPKRLELGDKEGSGNPAQLERSHHAQRIVPVAKDQPGLEGAPDEPANILIANAGVEPVELLISQVAQLPKVSNIFAKVNPNGDALSYTSLMTNPIEHSEGPVARAIEEQTAKLPSDAFLWAAGASIATSLVLKMLDRHHEALFVGQWAPTILILGLYNKLVKQHGSDQFHA